MQYHYNWCIIIIITVFYSWSPSTPPPTWTRMWTLSPSSSIMLIVHYHHPHQSLSPSSSPSIITILISHLHQSLSSSSILIPIKDHHLHPHQSSASIIVILLNDNHPHQWSSSSPSIILINYLYPHQSSSSSVIVILTHPHPHQWSPSSSMIIFIPDMTFAVDWALKNNYLSSSPASIIILISHPHQSLSSSLILIPINDHHPHQWSSSSPSIVVTIPTIIHHRHPQGGSWFPGGTDAATPTSSTQATPVAISAPNLEVLMQKFQKLSFHDQHSVTTHCTLAILDQMRAFVESNSPYLPQVPPIAFLFELMQNALNLNGLMTFVVDVSIWSFRGWGGKKEKKSLCDFTALEWTLLIIPWKKTHPPKKWDSRC